MKKSKLFVLGDSFGYWPYPKDQHWSNLIEEEYEVHNFAHGGSAYAEICFQSTHIKNYEKGDRLVVVLPEPTRISKYIRSLYNNEKSVNRQAEIKRDEKIEEFKTNPTHFLERFANNDPGFKDHVLYDWFFIVNLQTHFNLLDPYYVTWSDIAFSLGRKVLKNFQYISHDKFTTLSQEGLSPKDVPDYHPGIEGNKVWYNLIKTGLKVGGVTNVSYI